MIQLDEERKQRLIQQSERASQNPFPADQDGESFLKHKMLYDEYGAYLMQQIDETSWSEDMKSRHKVIVAELFYPEMKLANLSEREIKQQKSRLRLRILKARLGCDVDDTLGNDYVVFTDTLKTHVAYPISRSRGPERERMVQTRKTMVSENVFEEREPKQQKKTGVQDKLAGMLRRPGA